jgi:hypothetical protein
MRVYVESIFDCPPDRAWDEVQRPSLLLEVASPLIRLEPAEGPWFPDRWQQGRTVRFESYLFSLIPVGRRTVCFERVDHSARQIQTREHDPLIRHWDHLIHVRATDDGRTRYSDELQISGGPLAFFVWLFAMWFYRHRQRRWKRVAKRLREAP